MNRFGKGDAHRSTATPLEVFSAVISAFRRAQSQLRRPGTVAFWLHTDEDNKTLAATLGVTDAADVTVLGRECDLKVVLHQMISGDVIVPSASALAHTAALISNATVIYSTQTPESRQRAGALGWRLIKTPWKRFSANDSTLAAVSLEALTRHIHNPRSSITPFPDIPLLPRPVRWPGPRGPFAAG